MRKQGHTVTAECAQGVSGRKKTHSWSRSINCGMYAPHSSCRVPTMLIMCMGPARYVPAAYVCRTIREYLYHTVRVCQSCALLSLTRSCSCLSNHVYYPTHPFLCADLDTYRRDSRLNRANRRTRRGSVNTWISQARRELQRTTLIQKYATLVSVVTRHVDGMSPLCGRSARPSAMNCSANWRCMAIVGQL